MDPQETRPAPSEVSLSDEKCDSPIDPSARAAIGITTLVAGGAIIAVLTRYNLLGHSAYSTGAARAAYSWDEYIAINLTGLTLAPILLILGVFRRPATDFGFRSPAPGSGRIAVICYVAMLPLLYFASRIPTFYNHYPMDYRASQSLANLVVFELVYGFYFLCWEFFYRGFLTFGLSHLFDYRAAIVLQSIGFGIMHVGKPSLEFYSSFAGGALLGLLAYRAKSFLPCFLLHWAISLTFDVFVIHAKPGGLF